MEARRVNRKEVDYAKWDHTIKYAINSFTYGYSWYLDAVSDDWEAIIVNDYEYILPLPYRNILGVFKYYSQPILSQQMGPFGKHIPSKEILELIFSQLPSGPVRLNINLSENINLPESYKSLNPKQHINQTLSIDQDIATVKGKFTNNPRRALQSKLKNFGKLEQVSDPKIVLDFVYKLQAQKIGFKKNQYKKALTLFLKAKENNAAQFFQLKNINTGKVVVMGAVLIQSDRIINFFYTSLKGTENYGAASVYIFKLIEKFRQSKRVFDFDGSDIPGINKFFKSFGAETTYYTSVDKIHPLLKLVYKAKVYLRTRKIKG